MQLQRRHKPLIGLAGRARVGKDTAANVLVDWYGYKKDSFARPIREFVASLCGLTVAAMDPIKEQPHHGLGGRTPRYAMQTLGTEWGRDLLMKDLWIYHCLGRVRQNSLDGYATVIADVRMPNEAQAIRDAGGVVIHISRPDALEVRAHASENGIPFEEGDIRILNDGTEHDFRKEVVTVFQTIR